MARRIPPDRLDRLIDCATQVFIERGYRRTQMADVAARMGVAKGTLYLYVRSKEALFDLIIRYADERVPGDLAQRLPLATPKAGVTLAYGRERLTARGRLPVLERAASDEKTKEPEAELRAVLSELYETLARNRKAIRLIDVCARDYPELAELWFRGGREGTLALLERYIAGRSRAGAFRAFPQVSVVARFVLESIVLWAVHRHWDPAPQQFEETAAKATVVDLLVVALLAR